MRKFILTLVIVVAAAAAGTYFYLYRQAPKQTAVETVLPGDTLAVMRVCQLSKQIDRFRGERLGRALGSIDWPSLLTAMGVSANDRSTVLAATDDVKTATRSLWFNVLFGKDISVALLNTDLDLAKLKAGQMKPLLDAFVMVSRPTQPSRILESLSSMLRTPLSVKKETYRQWEVNRLPLGNGQALYYALADGLMIAGFSSAPVKSCLDQSLNRRTSLLSSETYRHYCADLYEAGKTNMVAFANVEGVLAKTRVIMADSAADNPRLKMFEKQLDKMQGIQSLNLVKYDDGGPIVCTKMIIGLDRKKMSPYLTRLLAKAPQKNPTLQYVPANALLYSWQNTFDLKLFWENLRKNSHMPPEALARFRQMFAEKTGVDLETFITAFGSQAGFLVNDIDMNGPIPVPELSLFAQVSQPEVIEGVIRRQVAKTGLQIEQESYADTDIHYVTLPFGGGVNPAYAFSNNFCAVAVNRELLKDMLSASDTGTLATHPDFKAFGDIMTSKNNSVFYLRSEGLIARIKELIPRGMSWLAMTQPDKAKDLQKVVDLGVMPLLDGLSMYKAVGGRTYVDGNRVCSDVQVLMDRTRS